MVADDTEQVARGDVKDDGYNNVQQQPDGGLDGDVQVHELEVDGDKVNDDEYSGVAGTGNQEDSHLRAAVEEVAGDSAVGDSGENRKVLVHDSGEEHAKYHDGRDGASVALRPLHAAYAEGNRKNRL